MKHAARALLIFLGCLSSPLAGGAEGPPPASPAEELKALLKEMQGGGPGFREARTDEERKAAVERADRYPRRFAELAEKYPKDQVAVDAAVELVRTLNAMDSQTFQAWDLSTTVFPECQKDDSARRIVALLLREHLQSEKLGPVCERMCYGPSEEFEGFLRAVLEKSPHREIRALALMALTQYLAIRVQKLELLGDRPELAPRLERVFGGDLFAAMKRKGRDGIAREIEGLLERAIKEFADAKMFYGGTVGEEARAVLFEMRRLAVGQEAPEIEGLDQDGKRFKLSDSRGKVVLLDFWQEF
jgi:hypothetical protein